MSDTTSVRLNKFLAQSVGISRREADEYIQSGRISINNAPAVIGDRINDGDVVTLDGQTITTHEPKYYAFNKPVGYVCSRRKQGDNETIYAILPPELKSLKTVGRLDKDSSGLILLTDDGDFTQRMTHPKFAKTKIYEVRVDRPLQPLHQQMINDFGVDLPDGKSKLILEKLDDDRTYWRVTMSEGRNRQIRRTFAALGYIVTNLHRTNFGPYSLGSLKPGESQKVSSI